MNDIRTYVSSFKNDTITSFLGDTFFPKARMVPKHGFFFNDRRITFVKHLGSGSYSDVYELNNETALKVPTMDDEETPLARFSEIVINVKLNMCATLEKMPCLCPEIYNVWEDNDQKHRYIFSMKKYSGTISQLLSKHSLTDNEVLAMLTVFISNLSKYFEHLHFRHGDMKLNNIVYKKTKLKTNKITVQMSGSDTCVKVFTNYDLVLIDFGMSSLKHNNTYIRGMYYTDDFPGQSETHDLRLFLFSLFFYTPSHRTTGVFFQLVRRFVKYITSDLCSRLKACSQVRYDLLQSFYERRPIFEWEFIYDNIVNIHHDWLSFNRLLIEMLQCQLPCDQFVEVLKNYQPPYPDTSIVDTYKQI